MGGKPSKGTKADMRLKRNKNKKKNQSQNTQPDQPQIDPIIAMMKNLSQS